MGEERNDHVTIAVLKTELRHLDERNRERHQDLVHRFDKHEAQHKDDAKAFEEVCYRITDLEHWRTQRKAEIKAELTAWKRINAAIAGGIVGAVEIIKLLVERISAG